MTARENPDFWCRRDRQPVRALLAEAGRIIPAFPGAGGGFDGNVLDAALTPRLIQPTTIGKTGGREKDLARVLHRAKIPCQIVPDEMRQLHGQFYHWLE